MRMSLPTASYGMFTTSHFYVLSAYTAVCANDYYHQIINLSL